MSSDTEYVAWGPTAVGFLTRGTGITIGVYGAGTEAGVVGRCENGPGVKGSSPSVGVKGVGNVTGVKGESDLLGVYGIGSDPAAKFAVKLEGDPQSPNTVGVLGDGNFNATGVVGLCFQTDQRTWMGQGIGTMGASNADSESKVETKRGAGVVGMSTKHLDIGRDFFALPKLPNLKDNKKGNVDGNGTGVWGLSDGGIGVHGQSKEGRGGVFESGAAAQINLKPLPGHTNLPQKGRVGDLFVRVLDGGTAELWFCGVEHKDESEGAPQNAMWRRVQMDPLVSS